MRRACERVVDPVPFSECTHFAYLRGDFFFSLPAPKSSWGRGERDRGNEVAKKNFFDAFDFVTACYNFHLKILPDDPRTCYFIAVKAKEIFLKTFKVNTHVTPCYCDITIPIPLWAFSVFMSSLPATHLWAFSDGG